MMPVRKGVDLSLHRARTGHMMIGIKTYGCATFTQHCKEYLQIKLKASIQKGEQYFIEYWVNPMSTSPYTNNIGIAFSDVEIQDESEYGIHYFEPIINEISAIKNAPNDWHRVSATITADANYDYILIGNFYTDEETEFLYEADDIKYGYYLIDDILIRPLHPVEDANLASSDLEIGNTIQLNHILFETDKANLLPSSFSQLNQLSTILKQQPAVKIQINGHTDNQGTSTYNLELSKPEHWP